MPLGTLDRTPPPFFNQGPSALSKLIFFSALALFLMVADARFNIVQPVRAAIGAVLYPGAVAGAEAGAARARAAGATSKTCRRPSATRRRRARRWRCSPAREPGRQLAQENARLRELLELRQTHADTPASAAEVLYDAADPYTRKVDHRPGPDAAASWPARR